MQILVRFMVGPMVLGSIVCIPYISKEGKKDPVISIQTFGLKWKGRIKSIWNFYGAFFELIG
jgi:hypothetical protein